MIKHVFYGWIWVATVHALSAQSLPPADFELVNLGRGVNSKYHDAAPVISPDGRTLYFTVTNHPENTFGADKSQDIWCSTLDSTGTWTEAYHMPAPFNKNRYNQVLSLSADGHTLLLRGGSGKQELGFSQCHQEDGVWQKPQELHIPGFSTMCQGIFNGAFMSYDQQALVMYFSEKPKGKYSDLYVSLRQLPGGGWSPPQPIASLNTHMDEFGPYLAPDNKTLYFASNRGGGFGGSDVYRTVRLDDSWLAWSAPENIGAPVNTDGFDAYYAVSNVDTLVFTTRAYMSADGGHLDIYSLKRIVREAPRLFLAGYVYNAKTMETVRASLRFEQAGETLAIGKTDEVSGTYRTQLAAGGKYILKASAKGFLAATDSIEITPLADGETREVYQDLYLQPIEVGLSVRLNNIFFDYNKASLRPASFPELDRVVEMLEENPRLQIEIGGHTDDRGSDSYNQQLSQERAEAVRAYLLEHWIDEQRVTAVGYGEVRPEVPNNSEEHMQINRRVAFTVLDTDY